MCKEDKFGMIVFVFVMIFGIFFVYLVNKIEVELINARYGTNYTRIQWLTSSETIKNYILSGEQKTLNLNIK